MVSNPKNFDAPPKAVIINVAIGSALNEPFHKSAFINVSKEITNGIKNLSPFYSFLKNSPNFYLIHSINF